MSAAILLPLPKKPTFEQAVQKYWTIKRLDREGHMDPAAMRTSLSTLAHDHPRLAPLCHPERSEGSHRRAQQSTPVAHGDEVLRCAQDDNGPETP